MHHSINTISHSCQFNFLTESSAFTISSSKSSSSSNISSACSVVFGLGSLQLYVVKIRLPTIAKKNTKIIFFLLSNNFSFDRLLAGDADSAVQGFYELLSDEDLERAVRRGDVFAAIVEHYANAGEYRSALATLTEMKNRLPKVCCFI